MLAVIAGFLGDVIAKCFFITADEKVAATQDIHREEVQADSSVLAYKAQPLNIYLDGIAKRNLFERVDYQDGPEKTMLPAVIPALENKIKLIGILVDKDSKAIVEDLQDNQTHFLSRGDTVCSVLLEEIRDDRVIFRYNNERFEMSL